MSPLALVLLACFRLSGASSFLPRAQQGNLQDLTPELEASILQEIEDVLGTTSQGLADGRVFLIEEMMRPTFNSLSKNRQGNLQHDAVRYTLHSYFVQRHGWYVRGLGSLGEEQNASSPGAILQDKVEDFAQAAFEQRMGSHGLDLKDTAVLAATYENLVKKEMRKRLDATYRIMQMEAESMSTEQLDSVLDIYMMGYILNLNYTQVAPSKLSLVTDNINRVYPNWPATRDFLREVRAGSSLHRSYFARLDVEAILEQVFDQYGRWQNKECLDLKSQLLALEDKSIGVNGSGRVRIAEFYGSALRDGNWQFSESTAYLAQNGALDTNGGERVIIANYINSASNCVASSSFYSVCCINECEDLMDHIEHNFQAPTAMPDDIVRFVSSLPSSTVAGGRVLPDVLVRRLGEIAGRYDDGVPLHGRLFAQWMHHAYPRECPYPHISGTTRPQTVSEYRAETQLKPTVSKDEMASVVEAADAAQRLATGEPSEECTQWSHHEELYVAAGRADSKETARGGLSRFLRLLLYSTAAVAMLVIVLQRSAGLVAAKKSTYGGKDLFV